ncbi:hypothetical protein CAAN1_05S03180 [[Candida] anglica]|uniref:Transcription factor VHR1 n=1 Tax=[Candida] anglica TaxID=148631 RepID=A0ABP0EFE4_9ASCO
MSESKELQKRLGITYAIRSKLNFLDERLWKRFSARRLELIDTLDLSSKKASEQEDEIRNVAEALRVEFQYPDEYFSDFDKLVRAAIQSVRRNRKRSSRSKKLNGGTTTAQSAPAINSGIPKIDPESMMVDNPGPHVPIKKQRVTPKGAPSTSFIAKNSGTTSPTNELVHHTNNMSISEARIPTNDNKFLSEILRLNSDSQEEWYDRSYSTTRHFSAIDKSRAAIDSMIQPRLKNASSSESIKSGSPPIVGALPSMPKFGFTSTARSSSPVDMTNKGRLSSSDEGNTEVENGTVDNIKMSNSLTPNNTSSSSANARAAAAASASLLRLIETSLSLSKSSSQTNTENLRTLGRNIVSCAISYVFDKSFSTVNPTSIEYLRSKLEQDQTLARIFRELDPPAVFNVQLTDEAAVLSLCTILGCCAKDFGFDAVIPPLGEIFSFSVVKDYPLISKTALDDNGAAAARSTGPFGLLNSLATVATDLKSKELLASADTKPPTTSTTSKKVTLKFLSSMLEFSYPSTNSAVPKLVELIENGKAAFKLTSTTNSSVTMGLRDAKDGTVIISDNEVEKIFRTRDSIELEMFVRQAHEVPISQITSTVFPTITTTTKAGQSPKILLPPPYVPATRPPLPGSGSTSGRLSPINNPITGGFRFLSNSEDTPTPPPPSSLILPNFQPLL